jgi:tetratricopeptide (TPR) repeat protein
VLSIVSTSAAFMIAQAKNLADAETIKANNSFLQQLKAERETRGAIDRMVTVADEFLNVPGAEQQTRQMYGAALEYYKKFAVAAAHAPGLQQDLGAVYFKAATMAHRLNHTHEAIDLCRRALAEFDAVLAKAPKDDARGIERATCRGTLAFLLASTGDVDAALEAYAGAIDEQRAIAQRPGTEPNPAALRALADTHSNLGLLLADIGRKPAARRSLTSGIELAEKLVAATPNDRELRRKLAISYNSLSFVEREIDWSRSEEACRRAIALLDELDDDDIRPDEAAEFRSDVALYYNNLGAILAHRGDWSAACDSYRAAIDRQQQVQRLAPAVPAHRRELAVSWNNLGQALDALDRSADAAAAYNDAQYLVAQLASDYPDDLTYRSLFGAVLNNRAMSLAAEGRSEEAFAAFERAIAEQQIAFDRAPRVFEFRDNLSKHYYNYGRALRAAGDPQRASELALKRRELWAGDSKHLSQVAVELAQTAVQARELAREDGAKVDSALADRLEDEVAATIREAAAAGGDLAELRGEAVFPLLQNSTIWTIINAAPTTTGP